MSVGLGIIFGVAYLFIAGCITSWLHITDRWGEEQNIRGLLWPLTVPWEIGRRFVASVRDIWMEDR